MRIANFNIASSCTPSNTLIFGSTYTISFTVTRERGDDFANALVVWLPTARGEILAYVDYTFSLAVGASREISVTSRPLSDSLLEPLLDSVRALSLASWGIQFGSFGTRVNTAFAVNVVRGWLPHIAAFSAVRSANGAISDEGEALLCGLRLSVSDAADPNEMFLRLHYASSAVDADSPYIDLSSRIHDALDGVADDDSLVARTFSNGLNWNFLLVFGDAYEQTAVYEGIPRAFANVHLSGCATGGVAFGKFSASAQNAPRFECVYPATFYGGITNLIPVSLSQSVSANGNMQNSGLSYTVPANSFYVFTARAGYNHRKPETVVLSTSADSASNGLICEGTCEKWIADTTASGFTESEVTLYLWAKWTGSSTEESVYLSGFVFTSGASQS